MNKFIWLIRKEFLILFRDIPGLVILFLMPALLILVISLAQVNVMKYSNEAHTRLLYVNNSSSPFSKEIEKSISASGFYDIIKEKDGRKLTGSSADSLIRVGEYQAALIIGRSDSIRLLLDPAAADIYHPARIRSLEYIINGVRYRTASEKALKGMVPAGNAVSGVLLQSAMKKMVPVNVMYAEKDKASIKPTITQNNIPGYILFAMFLIVIPVSGNMVNEKGIGYRTRFMTLPVRLPVQLSAKISLYIAICMLQFLLMFIVGWFTFPGFQGYLSIQPGIQYPLLAISVLTAAMGATGFGILVGSASSTHGQAALFGPLAVVILAAVSGSFIPVYLMPGWMKAISNFSPLSWGIENFITVFFRQGSAARIFPHSLLLVLFFLFSVVISLFVLEKSRRA